MECSEDNLTENKPEWLPDLLNLSGDWQSILATLYSVFKNDFIINKTFFDNRQILWNQNLEDGYPKGFWHLIEKVNYEKDERQYDPRRAERLPWCSPTITNFSDSEIIVWEYEEKRKKINTYLWLKNYNYLVVLYKKEFVNKMKVAFLVTAFYVGKRKKLELLKKYKNRVI